MHFMVFSRLPILIIDFLRSYAFQGPHPPLAYRASGVSWMNCKKLGTITIEHTKFDLCELLECYYAEITVGPMSV